MCACVYPILFVASVLRVVVAHAIYGALCGGMEWGIAVGAFLVHACVVREMLCVRAVQVKFDDWLHLAEEGQNRTLDTRTHQVSG